MVVRCTVCQVPYRLDATRIPDTGVRVRCPRCGHVFRIRRQLGPVVPEGPPPLPRLARPRGAIPAAEEAIPGLQRSEGWSPSRPVAQPPSPAPSPPARPPAAAPRAEAPPAAAAAPPPAEPPEPPRWAGRSERTLDLEAAPERPEPRLETAPFRASTVTRQAAANPASSPPPASPETSATAVETPPDHQRARRLARVLVSDILVYNQETRDRALQEGTLVSALGSEINKAWELYKSKVGPEVLESSDYFKEALNEILADGQKVF